MPRAYATVLIGCLILAVAGVAGAAGPDWKAVEQALGKPGQLQAGDVFRIGMPRTDLAVTVKGVPVKPGFALGSYAAFAPVGDSAMVMGDLVLLDQEVPAVMSGLFAGGRAAQRRRARCECLSQRLRQLHGVAVALVVHVHDVRRHLVEVIVDGGDLEATGEEPRHDGGHLLIEEHEVAHHHRAVAHLNERRVRAEREAGLHGHALHGHREIRPRHPDPEDIARLQLPRLAERLLDGFPIGRSGRRDAGVSKNQQGEERRSYARNHGRDLHDAQRSAGANSQTRVRAM